MKEFFRPTIAKIILFVILPVFYAQIGSVVCALSSNIGQLYGCSQLYFPIPLLLAIWSYITLPYTQKILVPLIIGIVISYLLSCLIVFIYKKIRKWQK